MPHAYHAQPGYYNLCYAVDLRQPQPLAVDLSKRGKITYSYNFGGHLKRYMAASHTSTLYTNNMDQFDTVENMLLKFSYLGIEESHLAGATLIGKAPHIAEEAWLNRIYPPITPGETDNIESAIKKMVPMSYAQFLTEYSNGLNVLGDSLCLYVYRAKY